MCILRSTVNAFAMHLLNVYVHVYMPFQALNAYLVVKLHEAMFEMKTQLKMMEAQVASIAKQKESLERTLQAKTKYIRVSVSTLYANIV